MWRSRPCTTGSDVVLEVLVAVAERAIEENWLCHGTGVRIGDTLEPRRSGPRVRRLRAGATLAVRTVEHATRRTRRVGAIAVKVDQQIGRLADIAADGIADGSLSPMSILRSRRQDCGR